MEPPEDIHRRLRLTLGLCMLKTFNSSLNKTIRRSSKHYIYVFIFYIVVSYGYGPYQGPYHGGIKIFPPWSIQNNLDSYG
jgi:hypothetical protein